MVIADRFQRVHIELVRSVTTLKLVVPSGVKRSFSVESFVSPSFRFRSRGRLLLSLLSSVCRDFTRREMSRAFVNGERVGANTHTLQVHSHTHTHIHEGHLCIKSGGKKERKKGGRGDVGETKKITTMLMTMINDDDELCYR